MGTTSFGVSFDTETDADLLEAIEDLRRRRDARGAPKTVPRSKVMRELVRMGWEAEKVFEHADVDFEVERGHGREAIVRQAVRQELERQAREE